MKQRMDVTEIPGADLYHPIEHAYICDWLGRPRPAGTEDINLEADYGNEQEDEDEDEAGPAVIYPRSGIYGWDSEIGDGVTNAVARLVLSNIQRRLPQWGYVDKEGNVLLNREYEKLRGGPISLMPRYLFTINWADSGPGFSWPEAYYATYMPFYEVYVVTSSNDGPDAYGYADLAMGHFSPEEPILASAHRIITENWQRQHKEYDHEEWAYLFGTGLVDEETAYAWREEVWGTDEIPEEELLDEA